jgi:hypothetical protein
MPRRIRIGRPLTAYSLAAAAATYAISGQAAALKRGQRLPAAAGSYAVSGQAASLTYSGDVIGAGEWVQMTVAAHSRKVIGTSGSGSGAFDPTYAQTVDALTPQTVSAIPWKSFGRPIMGEPGLIYYGGSLHSNYPGNEIDRIDVRDLASTVVTTTLSHQPYAAPSGANSGYGSGSGEYVYKQYGTALGDTTAWMPYAHHHWTKSSWHPTWGFTMQTVGARGDGATVGANPLGSGSSYQLATISAESVVGPGLISYDFAEGKYHVRVIPAKKPVAASSPMGPGVTGASDWNQHRMSAIYMRIVSGYCYVYELINNDSSTTEVPISGTDNYFATWTFGGTINGWKDDSSGNGVLIAHMEGSKHLCLRCDDSRSGSETVDLFNSFHTLFILNLEDSPKLRRLTFPSAPFDGINPCGDGNVSFCIDKSSRRVFWLVYSAFQTTSAVQFLRFYVSTYDDPMTWTEVVGTGLPTVQNKASSVYEGSWLASKRPPMWFYNGHLFVILPEGGGPSDPGYTNGAINLWRLKVDEGEELPAMTFNRYDYWAQNTGTNGFRFSNTTVANLQMIGTKHVSWAYSPLTGKYHQHAGDFGMSTCQSMCTLEFDGTARGYTFTEVLDEDDNAPSGKVRPASPDDGYWCYVPMDSAYTAGRGKFIWVRGGDGEPMFYNGVLKGKYGSADSNGTIAQVTSALADGWDLASKLYLHDPTTVTFTPLGATHSFDTSGCTPPSAAGATFPVLSYDGWTQDNGSTFWPDVWTASSSASRNGFFDPTTGCLWRFYTGGGLGRFDLVNKTVKMFNVSNWVSPETGRTIFLDGLNPTGEADVIADGTKEKFCWYDSGAGRYRTFGEFRWEHKATWIDTATGYLYVVSPGTGYLWYFDTRGTHTNTGGNGWVLPFGVVGERVPLNGTYPTMNSRTTWPPTVYNGDQKMNSLLVPFKGGLLYISCNHHDSGVSGEPHYAFWRRLGYTGPWSSITMPREFAANSGAAKDPYDIDNDECLLISQAYTDIDTRQFYRYFWRLS